MRMKRLKAALISAMLLLSGCAGSGAPPAEPPDTLSVSARFQTEDGDALQGGSAQFSTREGSFPLDEEGEIRVQGLPRNGEVTMTLQRQEEQAAMALSFSEGAVMDATTGEDGVGHITVREDADEIALLFLSDGDGALTCTLWLTRDALPGEGS